MTRTSCSAHAERGARRDRRSTPAPMISASTAPERTPVTASAVVRTPDAVNPASWSTGITASRILFSRPITRTFMARQPFSQELHDPRPGRERGVLRALANFGCQHRARVLTEAVGVTRPGVQLDDLEAVAQARPQCGDAITWTAAVMAEPQTEPTQPRPGNPVGHRGELARRTPGVAAAGRAGRER